ALRPGSRAVAEIPSQGRPVAINGAKESVHDREKPAPRADSEIKILWISEGERPLGEGCTFGTGRLEIYGSMSPARIASLTMLAVSCTPSFSRMRLRCESAVL